MSEKGRKFDGGKLRYDLIPVLALEETTKVVTKGAEKYDDENWKLVPEGRRRYLAAAMRHIQQWRKGEIYDEEMGTHHIANAISNLMFILEKELRGWEDSSEDSSRDISQEELKEYVEGIVLEDVLKSRFQLQTEKLWYPPVKEGENPWIEYDGSGQPVENGVQVVCMELHERLYESMIHECVTSAEDNSWVWYGKDGDTIRADLCNIVAYRIVS